MGQVRDVMEQWATPNCPSRNEIPKIFGERFCGSRGAAAFSLCLGKVAVGLSHVDLKWQSGVAVAFRVAVSICLASLAVWFCSSKCESHDCSCGPCFRHRFDLVLDLVFFPPVDITQTLWQIVTVANGTLKPLCRTVSVVKPELAGEVYAGKSLQLAFTWPGGETYRKNLASCNHYLLSCPIWRFTIV